MKATHSQYIVRSHWVVVYLLVALFIGHGPFFCGSNAMSSRVNELSYRVASVANPGAGIRSEHSNLQSHHRSGTIIFNPAELLADYPGSDQASFSYAPALFFKKCRQSSHLLFQVFRI